MTETPDIGDYVLATKWDDGDPGDPWAVGIYHGQHPRKHDVRHLVGDEDTETFYANGYRRVGRITEEYGIFLLSISDVLERQSPPGSVNLWGMLGANAVPSTNDDEEASGDG